MRATALSVALSLCVAACGSSSSSDGSGGKDAGTGGASGGSAGSGGSGGGSAGASGGSAGAAGSSCSVTLPSTTVVDATSAPELVIAGEPNAPGGIFDPSVVYPIGAPGGALSYSAYVAKNDISSHIAVSADGGATWTYVASANASVDTTATVPVGSTRCPSGTCSGRLVHEVSSLVYDADDTDATRAWKLFTHSYLVLGSGELAYDIGYIELFTAPDPTGPWQSEGKAIGWKGESDFSSTGAQTIATSFASLADCVALTEPAALWRLGGIIDLAVGCAVAGPPTTLRIELFRSLDHGKTFDYSGRLLDGNDALCLGASAPKINAADLFVVGGKTYLSATPVGPLQNPPNVDNYHGCLVFPLATGGLSVERDANGLPSVTRRLDTADQRFTGACTVAEGAPNMGYLVPAADLGSSTPFHVYESGVAAP